MDKSKTCDHEYFALSTHYCREDAGYQGKYTRLDVLCCKKCGETKDIVRSEYSNENRCGGCTKRRRSINEQAYAQIFRWVRIG